MFEQCGFPFVIVKQEQRGGPAVKRDMRRGRAEREVVFAMCLDMQSHRVPEPHEGFELGPLADNSDFKARVITTLSQRGWGWQREYGRAAAVERLYGLATCEPVGCRIEQDIQPAAAGQAKIHHPRTASVADHARGRLRAQIGCELRFETAIGQAAYGRPIGKHRQLRAKPPREAALDPDNGTQPHPGFAGGDQRGVILIGIMPNCPLGQHQSGMHASTRSGVMG